MNLDDLGREWLTESKVEPNLEAKVEAKLESVDKLPSDLTPQLVERVHKLYKELGRQDIRAVESLEKAEQEGRKDESRK